MTFGLIGTVAFAALVLFLGYRVRTLLPPLDRFNVPAPVIGGLIVAIGLAVLRSMGRSPVGFDTTLQQPLMIAFFTSLGFAASYRLLRAGGVQVLLLLGAASLLAIVQTLAGAGVALLYGLNPLFGVLTGAISLTGGPATSLAFAPLVEQAGVTGATPIALASAMGGIVLGSLLGAPIVTLLVRRHRLRPDAPHREGATGARALRATAVVRAPDGANPTDSATSPAGGDVYIVLQSVTLIVVAMWAGGAISGWIERSGITMPAYIGAMLVAGALRNLDDATGWLKLPQRSIDTIGNVALALFLVMALMNLDLLTLAGLAQPLLVTLLVQLVIVVLVCFGPLFHLMGRDYDAAVISGGFAGFMLGTTANAMAVMHSVVERYGVAPRAFLVAPLVGAFFLDFTNALIITLSVNLLS